MDTGATLLEREVELAALLAAAGHAALGSGSVVLVSGEAGAGKSCLLSELGRRLPPGSRLLVGGCDDLVTPRLLGPLRDIAHAVGAGLTRALRSPADRDALFSALLDELRWPGHATVLGMEDVHWADEATLDVLTWLARRVREHPVVLVLTYRDDQESGALRRLLASLATVPAVRRLRLGALSLDAVASLAGAAPDLDPRVVHALTAGNPFFVHEVLAAGAHATSSVPDSVLDLVQARVRRLDPGPRHAVEQLSALTTVVDPGLAERLVPGGLPSLVPAESEGLLHISARGVRFRHELTRRAVLDSLPGSRLIGLHQHALEVLETQDDPDPAQLVHHALGAHDVPALVRHGPTAARTASEGGAHRQAAEHLSAVLAHRDVLPDEQLCELLQASAVETYTVGDVGRPALADQQEAVSLRRGLGDPLALGVSLRWLSRIGWWEGNRPVAERAGQEAVSVLEDLPPGRELAMALSNVSQLAMLAERHHEALAPAQEAIRLAQEVDDRDVLCHALTNLGTARWALGDDAGRADLEQARDLALGAGLSEHASRAYCNIAWELLLRRRLPEAAVELDAGLAHTRAAEQVLFWRYLMVQRAMVALAQARWSDAVADASHGLEATPPIRCAALSVLARVAVRTGTEVAGTPTALLLQEGWDLGRQLGELQRAAPAGGAVCEDAWLRGDHDRVVEVARAVHDEATRTGALAWGAEAALWLRLVGAPVPVEGLHALDHPHALAALGCWDEAAQRWDSAGYVVEAAVARTCQDSERAVRAGLEVLDAVGARALADRARTRLRQQGADNVPRGPRPSSRANVAGLTARQLDVLTLLDAGLSNTEIAGRLVLSVRTVDHHVSALLTKLDAANREEATQRARALGWAAPAPTWAPTTHATRSARD